MDYSCKCFVDTSSSIHLTLESKTAYHGCWSTMPPQESIYGSWNMFKLKDCSGCFGSEGKVVYKIEDKAKVIIRFGCPFYFDNYAYIDIQGDNRDKYSCSIEFFSNCSVSGDAPSYPSYNGFCIPYCASGHPVMVIAKIWRK